MNGQLLVAELPHFSVYDSLQPPSADDATSFVSNDLTASCSSSDILPDEISSASDVALKELKYLECLRNGFDSSMTSRSMDHSDSESLVIAEEASIVVSMESSLLQAEALQSFNEKSINLTALEQKSAFTNDMKASMQRPQLSNYSELNRVDVDGASRTDFHVLNPELVLSFNHCSTIQAADSSCNGWHMAMNAESFNGCQTSSNQQISSDYVLAVDHNECLEVHEHKFVSFDGNRCEAQNTPDYIVNFPSQGIMDCCEDSARCQGSDPFRNEPVLTISNNSSMCETHIVQPGCSTDIGEQEMHGPENACWDANRDDVDYGSLQAETGSSQDTLILDPHSPLMDNSTNDSADLTQNATNSHVSLVNQCDLSDSPKPEIVHALQGIESEGNKEISKDQLLLDEKGLNPQAVSVVDEKRDAESIERAETFWVEIGAGLQNLGNTCFVNATIQCLIYTTPLLQYLLRSSTAGCRVDGVCLMCELSAHARLCLEKSGGVVQPHSMLQKLKLVARHMRWGRQEDAHEFLRYLVDALHKSCIGGHERTDPPTLPTPPTPLIPPTIPAASSNNGSGDSSGIGSESSSNGCGNGSSSSCSSAKSKCTKSVVNDIFAGYLRSQVLCVECGWRSNTFDPFLDLSLDVRNSSTLQKAFKRFVQPETLDTENAYYCTRCGTKVRAEKHLTLHHLPAVLNIQLKRYGVLGGKVTQHIVFPERLDVEPYMSVAGGDSQSAVSSASPRLGALAGHSPHTNSELNVVGSVKRTDSETFVTHSINSGTEKDLVSRAENISQNNLELRNTELDPSEAISDRIGSVSDSRTQKKEADKISDLSAGLLDAYKAVDASASDASRASNALYEAASADSAAIVNVQIVDDAVTVMLGGTSTDPACCGSAEDLTADTAATVPDVCFHAGGIQQTSLLYPGSDSEISKIGTESGEAITESSDAPLEGRTLPAAEVNSDQIFCNEKAGCELRPGRGERSGGGVGEGVGGEGGERPVDGGAMVYTLYAVLVHEGASTSSGHYYCYVRALDGLSWFCLNDQLVRRATLSQVLAAEAYLLFYRRNSPASRTWGDERRVCEVDESYRPFDPHIALSPRVEMCRGGQDCCRAVSSSRSGRVLHACRGGQTTCRGGQMTCRGGQTSLAACRGGQKKPAVRSEVCRGGHLSEALRKKSKPSTEELIRRSTRSDELPTVPARVVRRKVIVRSRVRKRPGGLENNAGVLNRSVSVTLPEVKGHLQDCVGASRLRTRTRIRQDNAVVVERSRNKPSVTDCCETAGPVTVEWLAGSSNELPCLVNDASKVTGVETASQTDISRPFACGALGPGQAPRVFSLGQAPRVFSPSQAPRVLGPSQTQRTPDPRLMPRVPVLGLSQTPRVLGPGQTPRILVRISRSRLKRTKFCLDAPAAQLGASELLRQDGSIRPEAEISDVRTSDDVICLSVRLVSDRLLSDGLVSSPSAGSVQVPCFDRVGRASPLAAESSDQRCRDTLVCRSASSISNLVSAGASVVKAETGAPHSMRASLFDSLALHSLSLANSSVGKSLPFLTTQEQVVQDGTVARRPSACNSPKLSDCSRVTDEGSVNLAAFSDAASNNFSGQPRMPTEQQRSLCAATAHETIVHRKRKQTKDSIVGGVSDAKIKEEHSAGGGDLLSRLRLLYRPNQRRVHPDQPPPVASLKFKFKKLSGCEEEGTEIYTIM